MQHQFEQEFVKQHQEIEKNWIRLDAQLKKLEMYIQRYQQNFHQTQFQPAAWHLPVVDAKFLSAAIH